MNIFNTSPQEEISRRLADLTKMIEQKTESATPKRKYTKRKKMFRFSSNAVVPLPPRERGNKAGSYTSPNTIQGRMTAKILSLGVGEMFTMTFDADPSEVSSRLTVFRRRFPDIKITARKIQEGVLGIWRIA